MQMAQPTKNRGFTIIEMLIVVTILAMLAGILVPVLEDGAAESRDSRRSADLRSVSTALANHFEVNGSYPTTSDAWFGDAPTYGSMSYDGAGYIPGIVPNYLGALPRDPDKNFPNATDKGYMYRSDGKDYKFVIVTGQSFDERTTFFDPTRPDTGWQVSSPGGYSW
jgi:prepilin-type N-terminal cleavage/methylation domain-containing protein